ncbi:MAG: hypothetical protein ACXAC5_05380 [Promethearchaeota archaeon]|jgi:predicted enzyme involved in methoxymalonyl-ACP biosynthesis
MARRDAMASSSISMSFKKEEVIATLKKNRAEHQEIYDEAVEGYRKKLVEALNETIEMVEEKRSELEEKRLPKPHLKEYPLSGLSVPGSSLKEYDTVLEMLSLTPDETIVLDQDQYNCYMKDNWYWMKDFLVSNSAYSVSAVKKLSTMR